jgi:hypothetical protein
MMNCTDFQNQIDDYCDGALSGEPKANCEAHLASCVECSRAVDGHNSLLISLKAMPFPGPSEGFAKRALQIAMESEVAGQNVGHHHRRGFVVGFGSAVAAALALWVVVGVFPQQTPQLKGNLETASVKSNVETNVGSSIKTSIPEFSIALNEQRDIKLAFFSSEELKGATITLKMPEAVALVGYEGQRELVWKTNLAKGDNLLRLPIIATGITSGQLVAHIAYKGKVKTLKVNLAIGKTRSAPELSGSLGIELRVV